MYRALGAISRALPLVRTFADAAPRTSSFNGSVNKVTLLGRLGADPVHKSFPNGGSSTSFNVVTEDVFKHEETVTRTPEWHRVVVSDDKYAQALSQILKKGNRVLVEGSIRTRAYTDAESKQKSITEIVVSRRRGGNVLSLDGKSD